MLSYLSTERLNLEIMLSTLIWRKDLKCIRLLGIKAVYKTGGRLQVSLLRSIFRGKKNEQNPKPSVRDDLFFELSSSLEENKKNIEKLFQRCDDLSKRDFTIDNNRKAFAFYFGNLSSSEQINRFILEQFMNLSSEDIRSLSSAKKILNRLIPVHTVKSTDNVKELLDAVYGGECAVLLDGMKEVLLFGTQESKGRKIADPPIEVSAIGPQESFVEDIELNTALLRRRMKTSKMKMVRFVKGRITKNNIMIAYIEGIVKSKLVDELEKRIGRIDTDGIIDTGHLRRFIGDNQYTPFPLDILTERPDRCVNHLLEGRIVLLVDGSPFALIYPSVFIDILKTADEAYINYYQAMFLRIVRILALFISTFGSAVYVALTVFNPGMIPTQLLITIASSRAGIPFPAIMEAFIMELTFEMLREANVRIPKPIGPAIGIVGGLVIGQSVVNAGIASQAMIIVVALTSISSFAVPGYTTNNTLRLIRFPFMLIASILGIYGIISLFIVVLTHMVSLRSLGVPYLSPLTPMNFKDILNTFLHGPATLQIYRPSFLEIENPVHTSRKDIQNTAKMKGDTK